MKQYKLLCLYYTSNIQKFVYQDPLLRFQGLARGQLIFQQVYYVTYECYNELGILLSTVIK